MGSSAPRRLVVSAKARARPEVIERNANAQSQLIADLLDVNQAIYRRIRLNLSQVNLSKVVDAAIDDARLALEAKGVQVHTDLERERAFLRGDGERLQQIVWNLLSNAIKFTPAGSEIGIKLRRVGSELELVVQDAGIGIDAAFLPHIFETFRLRVHPRPPGIPPPICRTRRRQLAAQSGVISV